MRVIKLLLVLVLLVFCASLHGQSVPQSELVKLIDYSKTLRSQLNDLRTELTNCQSYSVSLKIQLDNLGKALTESEKLITKLQTDLTTSKESLTKLSTDLATLNGQLKELTTAWNKYKADDLRNKIIIGAACFLGGAIIGHFAR
jgi:chromosome segregation ATPase